MDRGATCLPAYIRDEHDHGDGAEAVKRPNLTASIATRLADLELGVEDLFHHIVAVLHCSAYRSENAAALRMDWPRVPFPTSGDAFAESAGLGRELASLLDPQMPTQAVTVGGLRTELKALGVPSRVGGGDLMESDLSATAGWGSVQGSGIVMPGTGLAEERDYGPQEVQALAAGSGLLGLGASHMQDFLGTKTLDVYLNDNAYWSNVPAKV